MSLGIKYKKMSKKAGYFLQLNLVNLRASTKALFLQKKDVFLKRSQQHILMKIVFIRADFINKFRFSSRIAENKTVDRVGHADHDGSGPRPV